MPYATIDDLPASVRAHLPIHAQEIYRASFNAAYSEDPAREDTAHRVAWAAVKKRYRKEGPLWVERD